MASDTDHCKTCGSDDLHGGFYDRNGLASDGRRDGDGAKWDVVCNSCGRFQGKRERKPKPPTSPFRVGERVQMHPSTDQWMQGSRYAEVVSIHDGFVDVVLDNPRKMLRCRPHQIMPLA